MAGIRKALFEDARKSRVSRRMRQKARVATVVENYHSSNQVGLVSAAEALLFLGD